MDHRVRERVSLTLVENAAPVQYQVISFYQQHHRFPKPTEIKTGRLVQIKSTGIIRLSLDSVDKELQGSVLEPVPALEKGQLIRRSRHRGEAGKNIPSYCKKGEVIKPIRPLGPGESVEQKAVDWAAAAASLISATVGFSILALIFVGFFRLGFYQHWRIKSPTNRLVAYFHDNLDLTKPRILHRCLDKGADPNATVQFGRSLLYRAAIGCHADHMGPLLEHGADPNFRDTVEQNGDFVLTQTG
jgi:hypothetical protein